MRHATRPTRHSSWSLFLVPLVLPLVLVVIPGARGPVGSRTGALEVLRATEETAVPAAGRVTPPDFLLQLRSQAGPTAPDSLLPTQHPGDTHLEG